MVTKQLFDKVDVFMLVQQHISHIFRAYFKLDRSAYFGKNLRYKLACLTRATVWSRSAHTSQVDVQLNSTMRLISGTLHSTPLSWLPVLSNIEPPAL